jgi:Dyp-type peroxidase family
MSKLNATDIQGFTLRGYNLPVARYLFLRFTEPKQTQAFIAALLPRITTGQKWDSGKPDSTLNIALTHRGLIALDLPTATLQSFPIEFQEGMKARAEILGDIGANAPERWDSIWQTGEVHAWIAINGKSTAAVDACQSDVLALIESTGGATVLGQQDAAAVVIDGKPTTKEHFGFTDGFGNPDYLGVERSSQPGQGKLTKEGTWAPLATGELLLGYADEAGETPVAPLPHIFAANGTFMVYRKLRQNVAAFRAYLDAHSAHYAGGREKLAAKFVGRWRDGTPLELSPESPDPSIAQDPNQSTNFTYSDDPSGSRCPIGAHLRRVNPRDSFGFNGGLVNHRRITRRGLPYGTFVPDGQPVSDDEDRGTVFMALNASISRQFEFVQQQWVSYGNDSHLGNDQDPLIGAHNGHGKFVVQGDETATNPPFICSHLPSFVELRGGDYFFLPSITALGMIALGLVDPR